MATVYISGNTTSPNTPLQYHRVRVYQEEMYADEDVLIDTEQNYVVTVVAHIQGQGRSTINMHDLQSVRLKRPSCLKIH